MRERLVELIPEKQADLKDLKTKYGNRVLGEVTVDQVKSVPPENIFTALLIPVFLMKAIGGARGVKCMLWETSLLDAEEVYFLRFVFRFS